jgi:hypothetical protein
LGAEYRAADPADGPACPVRPRKAQLATFHLTPGFQQHLSWIEFRVPEWDATWFTLCLDGRLWEAGIGQTPQNGTVRVSVNTAFIDVEWLLGRLHEFQMPTRWELGYTTYTIENQR